MGCPGTEKLQRGGREPQDSRGRGGAETAWGKERRGKQNWGETLMVEWKQRWELQCVLRKRKEIASVPWAGTPHVPCRHWLRSWWKDTPWNEAEGGLMCESGWVQGFNVFMFQVLTSWMNLAISFLSPFVLFKYNFLKMGVIKKNVFLELWWSKNREAFEDVLKQWAFELWSLSNRTYLSKQSFKNPLPCLSC